MLQINTVTKVDLGVKDENKARDIFIDMNAWYAEYPNGTVSIWHKRNGDQAKYAAAGVTFDRETGILKWTPDAYDTYYIGRGVAEVRLTENDVIKKTKDILTDVEKSLVLPNGEYLAPGWQNYLNQIESDKNIVMQAVGQIGDNVEKSEAWATGQKNGQDVDPTDPTYHNNSKYYSEQAADSADAAEDAQAAAEEAQEGAEQAAAQYPYVSDVTGNWMVYDAVADAFVDTGVHAQGPQGEQGPAGDGVPAGGTTGQILTKKSNADRDTEWANAPDPTGKADKVAGATSGNFAALDASGNLTDSGKKGSDFVSTNQGAGNAGKALGIGNDGMVTPVPFSGEDFTGATALTPGVHGYVPAPAISERKKFLCGDGTWNDPEGSKLVVFDLDTVTNSGGSYTHTTVLADVTHDMKAVMIECDNPDAFQSLVHVITADGGITLTCDDVDGTSEVTVSCMFVANADPLTSSEFDILANRIGSLSALTTTDKSDLVSAVNEVVGEIQDVNNNITTKQNKDWTLLVSGTGTTAKGYNIGSCSELLVVVPYVNADYTYYRTAHIISQLLTTSERVLYLPSYITSGHVDCAFVRISNASIRIGKNTYEGTDISSSTGYSIYGR